MGELDSFPAAQKQPPCPGQRQMYEEADLQLNQKIGAPAHLSQSEQASAKALAELAKDRQRGFAEAKTLPPEGQAALSVYERQSTDLTKMSDLLTDKPHNEMDRLIGGADQLLAGTSLKLARAGDRVWLGDKDSSNEKAAPADSRYKHTALIVSLKSDDIGLNDVCPAPPEKRPK